MSTRLARQVKFHKIRQFHSTFIKNEKKNVVESSTTSQASKPAYETVTENIIGSPMHNVTKIDRWILVWVKRYPSKDQVPPRVHIECIQRAHTMVRIRIAFLIMGFAIVGFLHSAMRGKNDVSSGTNLYTERVKWYKEVKEKAKREAEAAEAAEAAENAGKA